MSNTDGRLIASHEGYIDFLRAAAAALVVVTHAAQSIPQAGSFAKIFAFGQIGVQIFFVASAYTLCASAFRRGNSVDFVEFMIRRFFRIWPGYACGIVLYTAAPLALFGQPLFSNAGWDAVSWNIILLHGLVQSANNNVVPGGWSIGTEWIFYILFPAFLSTFLKFRSQRIFLAVAASFLFVFLISSITIKSNIISQDDFRINSFINLSFTVQFPVFICGFAAFKTVQDNWLSVRAATLLSSFSVCIVAAIWLFGTGLEKYLLVPWLTGLSAAFFTIALASIKLNVPRLLLKFGERSYSIYLFHFLLAWRAPWLPWLQELSEHGMTLAIISLCTHIILTLVASYLLAGWTFCLIEQPGLRMGRFVIEIIHKRLEVAR